MNAAFEAHHLPAPQVPEATWYRMYREVDTDADYTLSEAEACVLVPGAGIPAELQPFSLKIAEEQCYMHVEFFNRNDLNRLNLGEKGLPWLRALCLLARAACQLSTGGTGPLLPCTGPPHPRPHPLPPPPGRWSAPDKECILVRTRPRGCRRSQPELE